MESSFHFKICLKQTNKNIFFEEKKNPKRSPNSMGFQSLVNTQQRNIRQKTRCTPASKPAIRRYKVSVSDFHVSINSPAHTKHLVRSPLFLLVLRLAYAYATHEQFLVHSSAHSCKVRFSTCTNLSGDCIPGKAKKRSPPHRRSSSFRRHP